MKKLIIAVLFLLVIFLRDNTLAQVNQDWVARYNGTADDYDEATNIAVDAAGNIYVTGTSERIGTGMDYYTIKYNASGDTVWTRSYNGPGNGIDEAYMIKLDESANVYVSGASTGSGTGFDYCIIKYNSSGIQQWVARYNGPVNGDDEIYSVAIDDSGNVYVTGYSTGTGSMADFCTIKYNVNGVQQWVERYDGPDNNDDYGNCVTIDKVGFIVVTGSTTRGATDLDYYTIKYNASGDTVWTRTYNGPGNGIDESISCVTDGSSNVYIVGYSKGVSSLADYCTIKYNSNGVEQWVRRYNGPGNGIDNAYSIVLDYQGNVLITGNSFGNGTYDDYCTIKYNSGGVQQWVARYNGPDNNDDYANWFVVDKYGNVYVTGLSNVSVLNDDFATVKYKPNGVQEWVIRFNGPGNEYDNANCLAIDSTGMIYVTGGSDNLNNTDYCTIRYIQVIGIELISNEVPESYKLCQNYPNPFNPTTKIKFDLPKSTQAKLIIYDILGREVTTLVNEKLSAGSYEVEWTAGNYPSGVYFYRLITKDYSQTKRMMLVK